ncbi:MAG: hypothetical protein GY862_19195 [Gammaproteobacteria bacterium]|nr:hypothetical protein [Gammaproteobacteria bacterium]
MALALHSEFEELLEPLGVQAAEFFLAAALYHAHKVSFFVAARLAGLSFEDFAARLREHFGTKHQDANEKHLIEKRRVTALRRGNHG